MTIQHPYKPRPIRFLGVYTHSDAENGTWQIKLYGISVRSDFQPEDMTELIDHAKRNLPVWLVNSRNYALETYNIATLILHEGKEGYFAILNWWIDENMLQNHVYLSTFAKPGEFTLFSGGGIMTCVWELAVIWFERTAWVEHILKRASKPDVAGYLGKFFNDDI